MKKSTLGSGDVRSELVAALTGNARASLRRVSSTAADEIAAIRQTQASTELITEGGAP